MKRFKTLAVVVLSFLGVGGSLAFADENPIDFKQSKNGWVVWTDAAQGTGAIFASHWEGTKWGDRMQVSSTQHPAIAPSVALDNKGKPWVVWSAEDGVSSSIYYSYFDGKQWAPEILATPVDPREDVTPAIAFDGRGKGLLVWGSVENSSSEIRAKEWNGEAWGAERTLNESSNTPNMMPAAAFAADGTAVVAWTKLQEDYTHIYFASENTDGKWAAEAAVTTGEESDDLATLKVEGETVRLFFEENNKVYASTWTEKGWTEKKLVDLSNSFYGVLNGLPGDAMGRAWFTWENVKGLASSFRYNVVAHDVVLNEGAKVQNYSFWKNALNKAKSLLAWVFEGDEAFAAAATTKVAYGDSIVAGKPGVSFVPFWDPAAVNRGVPGLRAGGLPGKIKGAFDRVTILIGTNDMGDGHSIADTMGGINAGINKARALGGKKIVVCTNIPRQDIFASAVARLAQSIRTGTSANAVAETFNPLVKNIISFTVDKKGHLNATGASKVGGIVRKSAK